MDYISVPYDFIAPRATPILNKQRIKNPDKKTIFTIQTRKLKKQIQKNLKVNKNLY
jgi:hypothetical protein